jgi:hypothetical protein
MLTIGSGLCIFLSRRSVPRVKDVIKDDYGGKLPSGHPFRPDVRGHHPNVRPRPRLPHGRGFIRGQVFTIHRRGKNHVRADATTHLRRHGRPRRREKNKKIKIKIKINFYFFW